ncbi:D-threonate 4-phosphate dehydrogenase [Deferribacterales bacterium RsTz2092]|nr:4-hydroxythreonine-4-phosphate dehydrogenase [Deferribacterales bacterium]
MKPIAVTIGDIAGVGAEITAKLLLDGDFVRKYPFVPVTPKFVLDDAFKNILHMTSPEYPIIETPVVEAFSIKYGTHSAKYGDIAMKVIAKAVELAVAGEVAAITTCPINKHSVAMAGYDFYGHTEYLGALTKTADFSMLLASEHVRVIPVTTHLPISKVAGALKTDNIYVAIRNAHNAGKFFGEPNPRIAVTGLNPHAGDSGTLGDEEAQIIAPAVQRAQADGFNADGPFAADSLFARVAEYDFVVAMYHDQALIPIKMVGFGSAVNITLGLPIIRTSVDHGTAFDIAGKGIASISSLKHAIIMAHNMADMAANSNV